MKFKFLKMAFAGLVLSVSGFASAGIIVHTSDFINDVDISNFNGFESILNDGTFFTGGSGPYIEDLISVSQINGDAGNDIWVASNFWTGFEGNYGWYPNGGGTGYTLIELASGSEFNNIGFNYGSGGGASNILFELFNDGALVLQGNESLLSTLNYLGFSGGGFDEIRIRDNYSSSNFYSGAQTLAIDSIKIGASVDVPEPSTLAIFALGMIGLASRRFKKQS